MEHDDESSAHNNAGDSYLSSLDPKDGFFRPEPDDIICGMFHVVCRLLTGPFRDVGDMDILLRIAPL